MNRPRLKFKETWLDKRIDYDGVYDFQCVDLAKLYLERLGFGKIWKLGNAKQVPQADLFNTGREKIVGTNDLMQGDIIIKTQGKYGHIAIVDRIVWGFVYVLEQNGSWKNSWSITRIVNVVGLINSIPSMICDISCRSSASHRSFCCYILSRIALHLLS